MQQKKRILIYIPVTASQAYQRVFRSRWQSVKSFIRSTLELEYSIHRGILQLTSYHHNRTHSSNKGDIAIGKAVVDTWKDLFDGEAVIDTISWGNLSHETVELINSNYDIFVIGGGGYIFQGENGKLNHRAKDIQHLSRLSIPVVAHGIGLNQLIYKDHDKVASSQALSTETITYLRNFSELVQHISVRDQNTQNILQDATGIHVDLTGDPVLFWQPSGQNTSASYEFDIKQPSVAINVAAHGPKTLEILKEVMPALEATYSLLVKSANYKLSYVVHEAAEAAPIEFLARRGHKFTVCDAPPEDMLSVYAQMEFVISGMLHSSIMSFNAGTPCINIAYDRKSTAFYDLFGLSDYSIPWHKANYERLKNSIDSLRENHVEIKAHIASKKAKLMEQQNLYLKKVVASLDL